jgi:hypothetical protein
VWEAKTLGSTVLAWMAAAASLLGGAPHWWLAPGWFTVILLVLMTVEMGTRYRGDPLMGDDYPWITRIASKLMLLSLAVVAFLLDLIIFVGMEHAPDGLTWDTGPWAKGFPVITVGALIWLCVAEAIKVVGHVERAEGPGAVPPAITWILQKMRAEDEKRFRATRDAGAPLPKRWSDKLAEMTEEEWARMISYMSENEDLPPVSGSDDGA